MGWNVAKFGMTIVIGLSISGCSQDVPAHLKPIPAEARATLVKKGMTADTPIYVRIFKEEAAVEVWKAKDDGRFYHFKTYPICNYSGKLGPKIKQGDRQAPEGFYTVSKHQMNPNSKFHLSFNLGYPNSYDRSHGRTGKHLMVHGDCKSAGCYAMTDALVEEIYILAREAFVGGQKSFKVHAFPFRMTDENMRRYRRHKWARFWKTMKEGYDYFEMTRSLPKVDVCEKRYLLNASFIDGAVRPSPSAACPAYEKIVPELYFGQPRLEYASERGSSETTASTQSQMTFSNSPTFGLTTMPRTVIQNGIRNSMRLGQ